MAEMDRETQSKLVKTGMMYHKPTESSGVYQCPSLENRDSTFSLLRPLSCLLLRGLKNTHTAPVCHFQLQEALKMPQFQLAEDVTATGLSVWVSGLGVHFSPRLCTQMEMLPARLMLQDLNNDALFSLF